VHPLDFDFDGGEIIFNLPNGMQGYMLTDAAGNRLNEGPINIVQDESQKDFLVRNGVSCMGCHSAGMIKVQDDIRYELDKGQTETLRRDREGPDPPPLPAAATSSTASSPRTSAASTTPSTLAGVEIGTEDEPILTTFLSFDENVVLRRAGAEFLLARRSWPRTSVKLRRPDLELTKAGGTVQRQDFTANYAASACILNLG
jgi:hypothetical protein